MRWRRNLRLSLRAIVRSWLRTALSVSGVAVGIASVVMLIGAGIGAERALRRALEPLGHNLLVVNAVRTETGALRGGSRLSTTLRTDDWEAIHQGEVFGAYRSRVETDTHCETCPGLVICAADCPRNPAGWAEAGDVSGGD